MKKEKLEQKKIIPLGKIQIQVTLRWSNPEDGTSVWTTQHIHNTLSQTDYHKHRTDVNLNTIT